MIIVLGLRCVVGSRPTCGPAAAVVAVAEEAAVVAVVVREEAVVVVREEEVAVRHEVVVALHGVVAVPHEVAAGRGALRARRQCRVHPIPRMDAPAEVPVIEPGGNRPSTGNLPTPGRPGGVAGNRPGAGNVARESA